MDLFLNINILFVTKLYRLQLKSITEENLIASRFSQNELDDKENQIETLTVAIKELSEDVETCTKYKENLIVCFKFLLPFI